MSSLAMLEPVRIEDFRLTEAMFAVISPGCAVRFFRNNGCKILFELRNFKISIYNNLMRVLDIFV